MSELKLNKRLLRKVRNRIAKTPESYDQGEFCLNTSSAPCGTAACIAGETIICAAETVEQGINTLNRLNKHGTVGETAAKLLGLPSVEHHEMFCGDASCWPEPFADRFARVKTVKQRAKIAVAYLDECLRRGKVAW